VVKLQVTVPPAAIFTVAGLKLVPAPLTATAAAVVNAATFGVEFPVRVVPPDVIVAVTVDPPGSTAMT
jgi:hypothetical protein